MKTKLTLVTLIACAAAGTTFAADPVVAFRASSGTTTNSADTTYVGNPVWASDAQQIGEKYVADLFLAYESPTFTWDSELNAFCQNETGYSDDDPTHHGGSYWQINAVFALTGTAQFTNAADATLTILRNSPMRERFRMNRILRARPAEPMRIGTAENPSAFPFSCATTPFSRTRERFPPCRTITSSV